MIAFNPKLGRDLIPLATNETTASSVSYNPSTMQVVGSDYPPSSIDNVQAAIDWLKTHIRTKTQSDISSVVNAVRDKGVQPQSSACEDVVQAINGIPTSSEPTLRFYPESRSTSLDMGQYNEYRYINTYNVPNHSSDTYTYSSTANPNDWVNLGTDNKYRYIDASNIVTKGINEGKASVISEIGDGSPNIVVNVNIKDVICTESYVLTKPSRVLVIGGLEKKYLNVDDSYIPRMMFNRSDIGLTINDAFYPEQFKINDYGIIPRGVELRIILGQAKLATNSMRMYLITFTDYS